MPITFDVARLTLKMSIVDLNPIKGSCCDL